MKLTVGRWKFSSMVRFTASASVGVSDPPSACKESLTLADRGSANAATTTQRATTRNLRRTTMRASAVNE